MSVMPGNWDLVQEQFETLHRGLLGAFRCNDAPSGFQPLDHGFVIADSVDSANDLPVFNDVGHLYDPDAEGITGLGLHLEHLDDGIGNKDNQNVSYQNNTANQNRFDFTGLGGGSSSFTISYWVFLNNLAPTRHVHKSGKFPQTSSDVQYATEFNAGVSTTEPGIQFRIFDDFGSAIADTFTGRFDTGSENGGQSYNVGSGSWYHVVAIYDKDNVFDNLNNVSLYVNHAVSGAPGWDGASDERNFEEKGQLGGRISFPFSFTASNLGKTQSLFHIGGNISNASTTQDAIFDNVNIWNRVLASGEIKALWNDGFGLNLPFTIVSISGAHSFGGFVRSKTPLDVTTSGQIGASVFAAKQFGPGDEAGILPRLGGYIPSPESFPGVNPNTCSSGLTALTAGMYSYWNLNEASGNNRASLAAVSNPNDLVYQKQIKLFGGIASDPLNSGTPSHWSLDEAKTFDRCDAFGRNDVKEVGTAESTPGIVSGSGLHMGLGGHLENDSTTTLDPGSNPFTVCGWIQRDSETTGIQGIIGKWHSTGTQRGWAVNIRGTSDPNPNLANRLTFEISDDGTSREFVAVSGLAPALDEPYFFIGRWEPVGVGGRFNIIMASGSDWTDRQEEETVTTAASIFSINDELQEFRIGTIIEAGGQNFRGIIDECSWWNRYLTDAEASGMFNDGLGNPPQAVGGGPGQAAGNTNTNNSAVFDEDNNEYFEIPHGDGGSDYNFTTSFTFAFWINLDSSLNQTLISKWNSTGNQRGFNIFKRNSNGRIQFDVSANGSSTTTVDNGSSVSSNAWHLVVCGWNSVDEEIFISIDAGTISTTAFTGPPFASDAPFRIGDGPEGGIEPGGRMDAIGIWNRVLNEDEIDVLYSNGNGLEITNTQAASCSFDPKFVGFVPAGNTIGGRMFSKPTIDQRNNTFVGAFIRAPGFTNNQGVGGFCLSQPLASAPTAFIGGKSSGLFQRDSDPIGGWIFGRPSDTNFIEQHSRTLVKARSENVIDQGLNIDNQIILFQRENSNFFGRLQTEATDQADFNAKLAVETFRVRPTSQVEIFKVSGSGDVTEVEVIASGIPGESETLFTYGEIDFGEPYKTIVNPDGSTCPGGVTMPTASGSVSGYGFSQLNPGPVGTSGIWQMKGKHVYNQPGKYIITTKFVDSLGMTHMRGFCCDTLTASGKLDNIVDPPVRGVDYPAIDISGIPRQGQVPQALQVDFAMRASGDLSAGAFPARDNFVNKMNTTQNPNTNDLIAWTFGNGNNSTQKEPIAFYQNPGFYIPVLRYQFKHPSGTLISASGGGPGGLDPIYGDKTIWLSESLLVGFNT